VLFLVGVGHAGGNGFGGNGFGGNGWGVHTP
jgi:hypothetical protein